MNSAMLVSETIAPPSPTITLVVRTAPVTTRESKTEDDQKEDDVPKGEDSALKRLRFNPVVRAKRVMSRKTMSKEQHFATWYNRQELTVIHQDIVRTVDDVRNKIEERSNTKQGMKELDDNKQHKTSDTFGELRSGRQTPFFPRRGSATGSMKSQDTTIRGLEDMRSDEALEERYAIIEMVVSAVLEEQRNQRRSGNTDPIKIANAAETYSRVSGLKARYLAETDECSMRNFMVAAQSSNRFSMVTPRRKRTCSTESVIYEHEQSSHEDEKYSSSMAEDLSDGDDLYQKRVDQMNNMFFMKIFLRNSFDCEVRRKNNSLYGTSNEKYKLTSLPRPVLPGASGKTVVPTMPAMA